MAMGRCDDVKNKNLRHDESTAATMSLSLKLGSGTESGRYRKGEEGLRERPARSKDSFSRECPAGGIDAPPDHQMLGKRVALDPAQ